MFSKKKPEKKEVLDAEQRGKAYKGTGPKSNKYIIKKQGNVSTKLKKKKLIMKN